MGDALLTIEAARVALGTAFWLQVALFVAVTGATVAAFTALAESRGSVLGGLLLTLPVKVGIAMAVLGVLEGAAFAAAAARAVPAGIAANVVFVAAAVLLLRRMSRGVALACALGFWLAFSVVIVARGPPGVGAGIALWAAAATGSWFLLRRVAALRGTVRARRRLGGATMHLGRAAVAGGVVGAALVLGRVAGSTAAGLASVFPSSWFLAMLVLSRHGPDLAGATGRVMVVGSAAPVVFGATGALLFAAVGVWWGSLWALVASAAATGLGAWVLRRESTSSAFQASPARR